MTLSSNHPPVERAQPWLGTLVSIRVEGLEQAKAHHAINAAFALIAQVHHRMSFYRQESDISRLNREALHCPTKVHPWTYSVLEYAQQCSQASQGCFDVSIGTELVKWGALPAPAPAQQTQNGSWHDIELLPDSHVVFHRPLWVDLGGIAKGFAVDQAAECLSGFNPTHAVVNAGGDLRIVGRKAEQIRLGWHSSESLAPVLELADGSVAGSSTVTAHSRHGHSSPNTHLDATSRKPVPAGRFTCVVAERCITADALTKIVMAQGEASTGLLRQFGASAWIKDPHKDWRCIGAEIP